MHTLHTCIVAWLLFNKKNTQSAKGRWTPAWILSISYKKTRTTETLFAGTTHQLVMRRLSVQSVVPILWPFSPDARSAEFGSRGVESSDIPFNRRCRSASQEEVLPAWARRPAQFFSERFHTLHRNSYMCVRSKVKNESPYARCHKSIPLCNESRRTEWSSVP